MPSIKNLKSTITEYDAKQIVSKLTNDYKPWLKFDADEAKTINKMLPNNFWTVEFDLIGGSTALANAFRSVILDEVVWPRITCHMEDIQSDDPECYKLSDYIQNRIWLIPTNNPSITAVKGGGGDDDMLMGVEPIDDTQLEINVTNTTNEPILVTSNHIKSIKNPHKLVWLPNISICELKPGRYIKIALSVETGINRMHASFCPYYQAKYKPLGYNEPFPPSYSETPEDYHLGFSCPTMCHDKPKVAVRECWEIIKSRLLDVGKTLEQFKKDFVSLPYITDQLIVTKLPNSQIRYEFIHETYFLGNLLAWYGYLQDESIPFIAATDDHPEDPSILIKIDHPDHTAILLGAIKAAVSDVDAILKSL